MMLRALLTIGAVQVLTMLVLLVRTKTLALVLGPELVGVMAVVEKLLALVAQTASLSLPFAAVRFLPARWAEGPGAYRDLFTRMRNVLLATALVACVGAVAATLTLPHPWGEALAPYRDVVVIAMLGLPVVAAVPFLQNAIAGRMQQYRSMMVGLLQAIALAAALVALPFGGLAGYYAMVLVLGLVVAILAGRMATRDTPAPASPLACALPPDVARFSVVLLALAFLAPYAALFAHYRVLSHHGAVAAGWMQAAIGISLSVRAVLGSAHAVFLTPNVNRGGTPAERMAWANGFQATLCLVAGALVPPLLLVPELAVRVLYSADFLPGARYVAIFVLAEVLLLLSGTYQSLVVAFDHLRFHLVTNVVAQASVIAFALALVGPLGILGAGIAALAMPAVLLLSTAWFLHRRYGLAMPRPLALRCAWLFASLLISGIIGIALPGFAPAALAAKALACAVILGGFIPLLDQHERGRMKAIAGGLKQRWKR